MHSCLSIHHSFLDFYLFRDLLLLLSAPVPHPLSSLLLLPFCCICPTHAHLLFHFFLFHSGALIILHDSRTPSPLGIHTLPFLFQHLSEPTTTPHIRSLSLLSPSFISYSALAFIHSPTCTNKFFPTQSQLHFRNSNIPSRTILPLSQQHPSVHQ